MTQAGRVKPPAEWEEVVKRALASELFRKSPKLRDLLAYTASQSLKGERELLSEQHIGVAVFGRNPGYNPGDDSIVRVQARNLREKLTEYFEGEGAGESIVITIPKGGYDLCFAPRSAGTDASGTTGDNAGQPRNRVVRRGSAGWMVPIAGVVSVAAFLLGFAVRGPQVMPAGGPENAAGAVDRDQLVPNSMIRSLFSTPAQTLIVLEDPLMVMASVLRGRAFSLSEFVSNSGADLGVAGSDPIGGRIQQMLPTSRHVQLANLTFAVRLLRFYPHLSRGAVFKHTREVQLREIQSSSCVLFGAQISNPWVELYEPRLNFHFQDMGQGRGFANRRPQPGEKRVYGDAGPGEAPTYARIALLPNFQPDTRVLIITGMGSPETEAAAEFVLDPKFLDMVPAALRQRLQTTPGHLEILLATNRLGRTAGSAHVEAWRVGDGLP